MEGCGSPVVKVSDHCRHVMSSIPVPLKTRRVGQRCTLNISRAETSSRWCGVVVRRGGCQLRCRPLHLTMVQDDVAKSPRVAEQCDVTIHPRGAPLPCSRTCSLSLHSCLCGMGVLLITSRGVGERGRGPWGEGFLPLNWGETDQNRTVTCRVLKAKANDRRKNSSP
ncbi:uncharacterized protein TNCV_540931 [Trichonephila clavipes]|nr:uncharacterized protein TNCV_540931 [Trichonephila clavipes]